MDPSGTIYDTDSEDELPVGWEERVTVEGRVYYANHIIELTQWEHPVNKNQKIVYGELPYGWERKINDDGNYYYVDHLNCKTTYTDPRLAFAVVEKEDKIRQKYDGRTSADQVLLGRNLSEKYVIVTGATSGIGFETVKSLSCHGAHVVLACRNLKLARQCIKEIKDQQPKAVLHAIHCDLSSLESVASFAEEYKSREWPLHVLILNAGIFYHPYAVTVDGFDMTIQVNYLSHFYLLNLLGDVMKKSAPARIVVVSAESHRFGVIDKSLICPDMFSPKKDSFSRINVYNLSKLCLVLMSKEASKRLSSVGVTCNAVHPGNVMNTRLPRHWWFWRLLFQMMQPFTKSKQQGASTSVFCAVARELEGISGKYFNNCFQVFPAEITFDEDITRSLWDVSHFTLNNLCKKNLNDKFI